MKSTLYLLFVFILLSACAPLPSTPPPGGQPAVAATVQDTPALVMETPNPLETEVQLTPSVVPSPTQTSTPVAPVIATAVGVQPCVPEGQAAPLVGGAFTDYPEKIKKFLNEGGSVSDLAQQLYDLEAASVFDDHPPVALADLTGDGISDVVVSINDLSQPAIPLQGAMAVFTCWEGSYLFTHYEPSVPGLSTPGIIHIRDINADGQNELIISSLQIGAYATYEFLQLLSWDGEQFVNLLAGITGDMAFPEIQITDFDQDGVYDLEVTSRGVGSIAAGPQRALTRAWVFRPESNLWELEEESIGFSTYRIHTLHDADAAMQRGEYQIGLLLYDLVINDTELTDWINPEWERINLGAYARFKIIVAYTLLGQNDAALQEIDVLQSQFPEGWTQRRYYEMADLFYNAYQLQGQGVACQAVHEYASQHVTEVIFPLGADLEVFPDADQPFGYGNAVFTPFNICP